MTEALTTDTGPRQMYICQLRPSGIRNQLEKVISHTYVLQLQLL